MVFRTVSAVVRACALAMAAVMLIGSAGVANASEQCLASELLSLTASVEAAWGKVRLSVVATL